MKTIPLNVKQIFLRKAIAFIEKCRKGEIEENNETFDWWAEMKLANVLQEKIKTIEDIEICQ